MLRDRRATKVACSIVWRGKKLARFCPILSRACLMEESRALRCQGVTTEGVLFYVADVFHNRRNGGSVRIGKTYEGLDISGA